MNKKLFIWIVVVIVVLPIFLTVTAYLFAGHYNCSLNEAFVNPCVVSGKDYGNILYNLGGSFMYMFFSIPICGIIVAIALIKKNKTKV